MAGLNVEKAQHERTAEPEQRGAKSGPHPSQRRLASRFALAKDASKVIVADAQAIDDLADNVNRPKETLKRYR